MFGGKKLNIKKKHNISAQTDIPTVKHNDARLRIWTCFAAVGPEHLSVTELTMNSYLYQSILESNLRPSL